MRFILALVCLVAVAFAQQNMDAAFEAYINQFSKVYSSPAEKAARFENFKASMQKAAAYQAASPSATFGATKYSDMTDAERRAYVAAQPITPNAAVLTCLAKGVDASHDRFEGRKIALPTSFDWRDLGKVTPVKDQGQCGSCWSFSTTGAMESAYAVKNNVNATTQLSEQAIVDCSNGCAPEDGQSVCNQGCNGGWPWTAIVDLMSWGGLPVEADYPYHATDGTCVVKQKKLILNPKNYTCLSGPDQNGGPADETTQMPTYLMKYGALSIALNAEPFFSYTSGIINLTPAQCEGTQLDHAVLIVGWGVQNNVPYWIVKNSWGLGWGEKGYVRMYRGNGLCGLNAAVTAINY